MALTTVQRGCLDKMKANNRLTAENLMEDARAEDHPLHAQIWALDENEAAKKYRLEVCRRIIGDYRFTVEIHRRDVGDDYEVSVRKYRPKRDGRQLYGDVRTIARNLDNLLSSTFPTLKQTRAMLYNLINQYRLSSRTEHLAAVRRLETALEEIDKAIVELGKIQDGLAA